MALPTFKNNDIISFQLVQNGLVGDERIDVVVTGVVKYAIARMIDTSLAIKHANLYPYFKAKVNDVDDPSGYEYLTVTGRNGVVEVIGLPWINDSTMRIIDGRVATIQISNWREEFRGPLKTFMASMGANFTLNVF